jgi:hypothetical protein
MYGVANLSLTRVMSRPPPRLELVRRVPVGPLPGIDEGLHGSAVGLHLLRQPTLELGPSQSEILAAEVTNVFAILA